MFSSLNSRVPDLLHFPTTWWRSWHDDVVDMMVRMLPMTIVRNSEVFKWTQLCKPTAGSRGPRLQCYQARPKVLQEPRVPQLQFSRIARPQVSRVPRFQSSRFPGFQASRFQGSKHQGSRLVRVWFDSSTTKWPAPCQANAKHIMIHSKASVLQLHKVPKFKVFHEAFGFQPG